MAHRVEEHLHLVERKLAWDVARVGKAVASDDVQVVHILLQPMRVVEHLRKAVSAAPWDPEQRKRKRLGHQVLAGQANAEQEVASDAAAHCGNDLTQEFEASVGVPAPSIVAPVGRRVEELVYQIALGDLNLQAGG